MKIPRISVLMPAYNSEQYIAEAIESILNQTFTDFEFIIINDGSTDNTAKIVKEYAKKDKRIKFIDNEQNQGFIATLNQCLDIATGKYVAKMDSDDISLPDRFSAQVEFLDSNPDYGMCGAGYETFGVKRYTVLNPEYVGVLDFLRGCITTIFMARRDIIEQNHLRFNKEYFAAEDYDFYVRFVRVSKIYNIQRVLYKYRLHQSSASHTQATIQYNNTQKIKQELLDSLTSDNNLKQVIKNFYASKTYRFLGFPILKIKYTQNKRCYYLFRKILIYRY